MPILQPLEILPLSACDSAFWLLFLWDSSSKTESPVLNPGGAGSISG